MFSATVKAFYSVCSFCLIFKSRTTREDQIDACVTWPSGVAILWKKNLAFTINIIPTLSQRLVAIMCSRDDVNIIIFSVYMPCNTLDDTDEFIDIYPRL